MKYGQFIRRTRGGTWPAEAVTEEDVSWWVTPSAYQAGYYTMVLRALRHWLAGELPFKEPYFSNREIPPW